ncbi:MAG: tRNA uridine-5-carboxymethylaminomethyl(34) synthesis GTPase MnmE [Elusimicrobiota bacterium]|jgi:tRNA modification GTPase|nr:tRNA uridine-5-carboxymethylaminomethyl(34) synthesis GTPase MnmE [Elusimicrobiota bacterium]
MTSTYLNDDTIAALSSGAGTAAIAVLRMSGPDAFEIADKIFLPYSTKPNQVKVGVISDGENKIDEAVCVFFNEPHSYTGEDTVEFSIHGNPLLITEVMNLLIQNGARVALPGEFTFRSYTNGKRDLAQAEAVCAMIAGKTQSAAKAALNNMSGGFSNKINHITDELKHLLTYLEAALDHPEDDIPELTQDEKAESIEILVTETQKLIDVYKVSRILQVGLKAVIVGKPNVGKSSLLNAVLGKNRAIVTEIPGTTTDTIEETIDCKGVPLTIIDTAGIRDKKMNSIEILGQEKAKEAAKGADILIWLFDSSIPLGENDYQIERALKDSNFKGKIFLILNKSDLPAKITKEDIQYLAEGAEVLSISTSDKASVDVLIENIAKTAGLLDNQEDLLMINSRHWGLLNDAQKEFLEAKQIVLEQRDDEIVCLNLRTALKCFDEILGTDTPFDVLDGIFSTFCIGK